MKPPRSETQAGPLPSTTRSLPIALVRAREKAMAPIREMLNQSDITEQQWRVLRVLSEYGSLDTSNVAEKASLLQSSLARIAQSMVEKGYVSRENDTTDRRRQTLSITEKGQQIIDDNTPTAREIEATFRSTLGDKNLETLLDLLKELDRL